MISKIQTSRYNRLTSQINRKTEQDTFRTCHLNVGHGYQTLFHCILLLLQCSKTRSEIERGGKEERERERGCIAYTAQFTAELLLTLARERGGMLAELLELLCFRVTMNSTLSLLRLLPLPFHDNIVLGHWRLPSTSTRRKERKKTLIEGFRFVSFQVEANKGSTRICGPSNWNNPCSVPFEFGSTSSIRIYPNFKGVK